MAKKYSTTDEKEKTSLFMNKEHIRGLRYISFTEEKTQTDLINQAVGDFIAKWEKKNGPIPQKSN